MLKREQRQSLNIFRRTAEKTLDGRRISLVQFLTQGWLLDIHSIYENAFTLEGEKFESKAEGDLDVNTFNVKIGFKAGNKFYFRTELGYGFGSIPQEILVTGTINDTPVQGIKEVPDVPGISENGYPLFNIGVGFSF